MSQDIYAAAKSEELSALSMYLIDIADEITIIFDEIDKQAEQLNKYLKCEAIAQIMNEYNRIKANYAIVHNNINTYSEDLIKVNNNLEKGMNDIRIDYEKQTEEFQKNNKEVNL